MKYFALRLFIVLLVFVSVPAANAQEEIKVFVEGQQVKFDAPPIMEDGRVLVPVRAIFEALGAEVEWDGIKKLAHATKDNFNVDVTVNEIEAFINGGIAILDVPARLKDGRVIVPLRFSGQAFGAVVDWDEISYTVNIYYREPINVEVSDIKNVFGGDKMTNLKFTLSENGKFWLTYVDNINAESSGIDDNGRVVVSYYDNLAKKNTVINTFPIRDYQIDNQLALQDGRILVALEDYTKNHVVICLFDYKDKSMKEIGRLSGKYKIYTVISSKGDVLYYEDNPSKEFVQTDFWKMDLEGKISRLTNTPDISESDPQWSPDGSKIAFRVFNRENKKNDCLSVMDSDGKNRHSFHDAPWGCFSWSPDSKSIAFIDWRKPVHKVFVSNLDSNLKKQVLSCINPQSITWSPDGTLLTIQLMNDFALCSSDGSAEPQLYSGSEPLWSNDSKLLLFDRFGETSICDPIQNKSTGILIGAISNVIWEVDKSKIYYIANYDWQMYEAVLEFQTN